MPVLQNIFKMIMPWLLNNLQMFLFIIIYLCDDFSKTLRQCMVSFKFHTWHYFSDMKLFYKSGCGILVANKAQV